MTSKLRVRERERLERGAYRAGLRSTGADEARVRRATRRRPRRSRTARATLRCRRVHNPRRGSAASGSARATSRSPTSARCCGTTNDRPPPRQCARTPPPPRVRRVAAREFDECRAFRCARRRTANPLDRSRRALGSARTGSPPALRVVGPALRPPSRPLPVPPRAAGAGDDLTLVFDARAAYPGSASGCRGRARGPRARTPAPRATSDSDKPLRRLTFTKVLAQLLRGQRLERGDLDHAHGDRRPLAVPVGSVRGCVCPRRRRAPNPP